MDIPKNLTKKRFDRESVVFILTFTEGKTKLIYQPEII